MTEKKDTGIGRILFGILGASTLFLGLFQQIWNFLEDTNLTWILFIIGGILIAVLLYLLKIKLGEKTANDRDRVKSILEEEEFWGKDFSQWLIKNNIDIFDLRINQIVDRRKEWGEERIKQLLEENIQIGMTEEMVKLSMGEPAEIIYLDSALTMDNFKWVYQQSKRKVINIHFENQIVSLVTK